MNNKEIKCPFCGKSNWESGKYPFIRVCATPGCKGVNWEDVQKLCDVEGYVFDDMSRTKMTIEELEKRMKQNIK